MPASVTELALLTIPPLPLSPALTAGLARAKAAMQRFSGQPFTYLLCEGRRNDRSLGGGEHEQQQQQQQLFIVGGWPSIEFHMEQWIPCEENQGLVRELGELGVGVRWMWHVGVEREVVERILSGDGKGGRVVVWRASVLRGRFGEVGGLLKVQEERGGGKAGEAVKGTWDGRASGWRLDDGFLVEGEAEKSFRREGERDEVVMLVRSDDDGRISEIVEHGLEEVEALVERWEAQDCTVLDI